VDKRVFYDTWDVSAAAAAGDTLALGVRVGPGFWGHAAPFRASPAALDPALPLAMPPEAAAAAAALCASLPSSAGGDLSCLVAGLESESAALLARVTEHRRASRVARDHQSFDARVNEVIHDVESKGSNLCDGPRAIGATRGIPHVDDRLVRYLIEHSTRDGEPAHA
jgi:hypothetical protein